MARADRASKVRWLGVLGFMAIIGCGHLAISKTASGQDTSEPADSQSSGRTANRRGMQPQGPPPDYSVKLVRRFDANKDGWLNAAERKAARESLRSRRAQGGFGPGPGGPSSMAAAQPKPGPQVSKDSVPVYPNASLYDPDVLRTIFLDFEDADWETELSDFHGTDVDVPALMTVDGKQYSNVGVHFRGMTSYMMVPAGYKRSLNISMDMADSRQRLYGYKTLNLLNCHEDPSMMSNVLYSHIARQFTPALKANYVKLVINGESCGVYVNLQQCDQIFLRENYEEGKWALWKVRGSPGAAGGLDYKGEDVEAYKRFYEAKSGAKEAWDSLINLCRTLNKTPVKDLERAAATLLDLDNVLWFLTLDIGLQNADGYWQRASDYSIARDGKGIFRVFANDTNECFKTGGPGMPPPDMFGGMPAGDARGPGSAASSQVDPLYGLDDERTALRSRLLAVPSIRAKYLGLMQRFAEEGLDWQRLGPVVKKFRNLIDREVEQDTRKLSTYAAFQRATADVGDATATGTSSRGGSIKRFVDARRKYLIEYCQNARKQAASAKTAPSAGAVR